MTFRPAPVSLLVLAAMLGGCTVGPDYQKPETALPQKWVSSGAETSAQGAVDQSWWKNFHDPVLDQLIAKASAGNLDLKIAEARIAEARAASASADAALLPGGDLSASANRQANRIAFPGGNASSFSSLLKKPFNTFQTGFDASWELDLFGGHRREAEAANAELQASEASREDVMVSLHAEVARTYVEIRQYQQQLKIAEDTVAADQKTLDIATQRFNAGEAPGLDVTQARSQLEQAKTRLPDARSLLAQAEYSMDLLLGEQPGATARIAAAPAAVPASDQKLVLAAPASVIADRPDIRVAERKLAAATAQQGAAVAKFFPDVSLSGFFGLLNTSAGDLLAPGSKSWMVGGNVLWPILSYGSLSANLHEADARQEEALATYQKTVLAALSDVEKALTAYTEQEKFRQSLAQSTADDRQALAVAEDRYKQGLTSFLEVLDAERTLYASQEQLNRADAQAAANLIALYKSLGGGWQTE